MRVLGATLMLAAAAAAASTPAHAAKAIAVPAKDGETTLKNDLYVPEKGAGPFPLVVVIHEWWGKNDYAAKRARQVADQLGYAALAVDLYGDAKTVETPTEAQALATPFYKDPQTAVKRLQLAVDAAREAASKASVAMSPGVAAIGYCFGGSQALNLARSGAAFANDAKLVAAVSFHGGLGSSLKAKAPLTPKILVLHGESDPLVKPEEVAAFKEEMKEAGADLRFRGYARAMHAFTNPKATEIGKKFKIPVKYDATADRDSWELMTEFLKSAFGK